MDDIEQASEFLTSRGFARTRFCFTGSAGLKALSSVATCHRYPRLLARRNEDIDVICLPDDFDKATRFNEFATSHDNGIGDCLNIRLQSGLVIELTRHWPVLLRDIHTQEQLREVAIETSCGLVLDPGLIAALKLKRMAQKDLDDLQLIACAHGTCSVIRCPE